MTSRIAYAELVRHFLSGRITNHEYEKRCDALLDSGDEAISQIYCRLWNSYCDFREHRMGMKHGMTRDGRRIAARWIMFLRSGRRYEYPIPGCLASILSVLILGLARCVRADSEKTGDDDVWPYFRRTDYETDLARPTYLAGAATTDQTVR